MRIVLHFDDNRRRERLTNVAHHFFSAEKGRAIVHRDVNGEGNDVRIYRDVDSVESYNG